LSSAPAYYRRKTKNSRIDYPIASAAFIKDGQQIRMAIGGVFHFPVRSLEAETVLNDLDPAAFGTLCKSCRSNPTEYR
jgi:CO/xanthine dehydrogenase FAD-binding subunit